MSKTNTKSIRSISPVRLDLAGGTLDLWPLSMLVPGAQTLNVAISLFAKTTMSVHTEASIIIFRSKDLQTEMKVPFENLSKWDAPFSFKLHAAMLLFFIERYGLKPPPKKGLCIETSAESPAGAGLGGSSALAVSLCGAFLKWVGAKKGTDVVAICKDVETKVLHTPAGTQDHIGSLYGGLLHIAWKPETPEIEQMPFKLAKEIEKRLWVIYSGKSRNSGMNNWEVMKQFLDKNPNTSLHLNGISKATAALFTAIKNQNWTDAGAAIQAEWEHRKQLAPNIATSEMNDFFSEIKSLDMNTFKVCGAGGGGCFYLYDPKGLFAHRNRLLEIIKRFGFQVLPFSVVRSGLHVTH